MEKKIKWLAALFAACALALVLFGCKRSSGRGDDYGTTVPAPEGFVSVNGRTVVGAKHPDVDDSAEAYYKGVFVEGRTVTLSPFYIGKYEVTQEEYESVMSGQKVTVGDTEYTLNANPSCCTADSSSYKIAAGEKQERRPVECVTWYDAVYYCNLLSKRNGYDEVYKITVSKVSDDGNITEATVTMDMTKNGYRLPTEAEWEYAARGGNPKAADWNYLFSGSPTASGVAYNASQNSGLDAVGWYWYNTCNGGTTTSTSASSGTEDYGTHEVGKKKANALGLYDMSGNVWEWCWVLYGDVSTGTVTDPTGASSGSRRVLRGGSWGSYASNASVCYRYFNTPSLRCIDLGFRVVRSATAQ